jgi:hypothetical protein
MKMNHRMTTINYDCHVTMSVDVVVDVVDVVDVVVAAVVVVAVVVDDDDDDLKVLRMNSILAEY